MIAIMMAMSFGVAMAVAFIIKQTTLGIERVGLMHDKGPELRRVQNINRITKKTRKREIKNIEKKSKIEMIDHYYGDNNIDKQTSSMEFIEHFYPKK